MKWTLPLFLIALAASAVLYTSYLDSEFVVWFGITLQLGGLVLGIINLNMVRRLYRANDEPRNAWAWFMVGIILWTIAQILDIYIEIILHEFPYETISDVFWLAGYVPFVAGMILLIRSFMSSGLPAGRKLSYVLIAVLSFAIYVAMLVTIILPDLNDTEKSFTYRVLQVGYPALDFLLLGMAASLAQISWALRGGSLAKSWLFLCAGFALGAAADLVYGHFPDIESSAYRYLDIPYFSSYFCIAIAGSIQIQMLRASGSPSPNDPGSDAAINIKKYK